MVTRHRGLARAGSQGAVVLAAGCLGLAAWGLGLPGAAQATPKIEKLQLAPSPAPGAVKPSGCDAVLAAGFEAFQPTQADWVSAGEGNRIIRDFGKASASAEERALAAFDRALEQESVGKCAAHRSTLLSTIRKEAWAAFLVQRRLAEIASAEELHNLLFRLMKKRGAPLRVREKMDLLQEAVAAYGRRVDELLPEWAAEQGDPERQEAERRMGEMQFSIEDSGPGVALRGFWAREKSKRLINERAHGVSVSLDPGLRVMFRPEGLGNFQVFSSGPIGPPNLPATMNVGVMNDGSMADVYREHPVPPLVSLQPAVQVNLNVR